MHDAIRPLLEGAIDYAGLFPPAKLDMEPALDEYLRHFQGEEGWLVDQFVCPANRLGELAEAIQRSEPATAFGISVVGSGGATLDEYRAGLDADQEWIHAFRTLAGGGFIVDSYETKPGIEIGYALEALKAISNMQVYVEVPWGAGLRDAIHEVAERERYAVKARTGGLTAESFPSAESLATVLQECLRLETEFKLTAGLHHALPHEDPATGGRMHGFINVFVAAATAYASDLSLAEIAQILEEREPLNFIIDDLKVGWDEFEADWDTISEMRAYFQGFGSCSVREPLDDLAALGLWRPV